MMKTKATPEGAMEDSSDESGLDEASYDLIQAIEMKNAKRVSAALKAAFEICDSYPHEEGDPIDEGVQPNGETGD